MSENLAVEATSRRSGFRMSGLRPLNFPYALVTLTLLILAWQFGCNAFHVPNYILPRPTQIVTDILGHLTYFIPQIASTAMEILIGFFASILIGLPIAVLLTFSRALNNSIYPLIVGSQVVPKVAIAPLLMTWFGFGLAPKIVIVITIAFFPIVVNAVVGLSSAPPQMIYLAQSMGASIWQIFWCFRFPQALPNIMAGVKMAAILAVIGAVVAEFVGSDSGLGYAILTASSNFDVTRQFSSITLLTVLGLVFFWVIEFVERRLLPWHVSLRPAD